MPHKFKNAVILCASIYFYSWGGPKFIFVILGTTFLDFLLVNTMQNQKTQKSKRVYLIISLCLNLGLLFYFKYCNFFIENINAVLGTEISWLKVVLPIGISFYTFESLTYVIDVYRGVHKPLKNVWHYQTYILLFPKLIAGPIVRYHDIADQITNREKNYTAEVKLSGFLIFCLGLAKKTIIANTLGMQADAVFKLAPEEIDTAAAWIGAIAYTFQIYFDFSGYSDMAIGLGKIMGFKFPENFNNPYISGSITEFWRRWHITLGAWMKNYLYIPMGGNKVSNSKLYRNLILVFLFSGLWHGASWNFVLWGAYHGLFLVLERLFLGRVFEKLGKFIAVPITFLIVITGWVLFRNEDLGFAVHVIKQMYSFEFFHSKFVLNNDFITMAIVATLISFFTITTKTKEIQNKIYGESFSPSAKWAVLVCGVILYYVSLSYVSALDFNPFIYFRF
ncbi:MBOAT family O-acyltransferase [Aurantibacillus circumpalustris]|uniref:MBOAT family O-acyltransferase n=1 Tax=Aurantibacillus circumpalustris TaxID=3036359 RepID=UPI00295C22A9|nr:MBOAT family protein [Aurantibacillus circumpalustris]